MTANCNCSADIRVRISTALKVRRDIDNVWKNESISKETKMRLFNALLVPIALYGCSILCCYNVLDCIAPTVADCE